MRRPSAATAYTVISTLLFPVSLLGSVIWIGKGILPGNRSGVSFTAQSPLSARWAMHLMGTRRDEPADRLMPFVPGLPAVARRLVSEPALLAHRVTGYVPRAFAYPFEGDVPKEYEGAARVTFFDQALERYLPEIDQFVILGAGFDTRPYRLPPGTAIRSFEVDTPKTQAVKRAMLEQAGIDTSTVAFVAADFETEDWLARLVTAGFDPAKRTFFLWEGVMLYLDGAAVEDSLRKIAGTAPGSVVAFDYFTTEALTSTSFYWWMARVSTRAAGEPIKFGIESTPPSRERLAEFLQSCGLTLREQRTLGQETQGERAWGGFAVAGVAEA
jgi:methyltransferase (TIGR00027 family)